MCLASNILLLLLLFLVSLASSWNIVGVGTTRRSFSRPAPLSSQQRLQHHALDARLDHDDSDNNEDDDDDLRMWMMEYCGSYLTPSQVKTLRKDASKRKARNQLATFTIPELERTNDTDESEDDSIAIDDVLSSIIYLLQDNELVQVRGICRNEHRRHVRSTSEQLAVQLMMLLFDQRQQQQQQNNQEESMLAAHDDDDNDEESRMIMIRPVVLLQCKGHSAIYYSPAAVVAAAFDDDNTNNNNDNPIVLRSSYQPNAWTKKPRPKRDSRGQIIKGEYY